MHKEILFAIDKQISFLEKNVAPKGQEAVHMECLNVLRQARLGNFEELEAFREEMVLINEALRNPVTREMVEAKKFEEAKTQPILGAALQDNTLQESIKSAQDAIFQPALQSVMYLGKILIPVISLMDDPDED